MSTDSAPNSRRIVLHVPFTFFPDPSGGTEVYVLGLARRLSERGYASAVAAPAMRGAKYFHHGLTVHRFSISRAADPEYAYGAPDETAAAGFAEILARVRPQIVHLHARTSAVSDRLIDVARDVGAKVVFTYHTPTVSCARGTMMQSGTEPCDGIMDRMRCVTCLLQSHGLSRPIGAVTARVPGGLSQLLPPAAAFGDGPFGTAVGKIGAGLRVPDRVDAMHRRVRRLLGEVDHVVAVCQWVFDVLERNGVPRSRLTLSRQGLECAVPVPPPSDAFRAGVEPGQSRRLRVAFFGRLDKVKGIDVLVQALKLVPDDDIGLDIYAVGSAGSEWDSLATAVAADPRIAIRPATAPETVTSVMAGFDVIAIPSRWLETGPLVALEAFAAGVPVLASRLGGIEEIVTDGVDGVLVPPARPADWADALRTLHRHPERLERLSRGIRPPRTMNDCADDMIALYDRLLAS